IFQSVAMFWMALIVRADTSVPTLIPILLLAGVGMGLVFAPISTAVLAGFGLEDNAKASGTSSTLREIGIALGIAVLTAVFIGAGGTLTPTGYVHAAIPALVVGGSVLALGAILALFLPVGLPEAQSSSAQKN
ncbi:MAG: MFS transporter, partial [Cryobacterium sp.]|nr:MFS transporter [Cryobacterium sp.]